MGLFTNKKKGIAPHIWYPEILHWQEGDEVMARNVTATNIFLKIRAVDLEILNMTYLFKSVTNSGFIIVEEKETGELHKIEFYKFIRKAKNLSLRKRLIIGEIEDSKGYMELMSEFRKAYQELESSDQKKLES